MPPKQPVRLTSEQLWDDTFLVGLAAVPLPLSVTCNDVLVQADPDNGGNVFIGNAVSQSVQLAAGAVWTTSINNPAKIYVRGSAAGQRVNFHAGGGRG